MARRFCIGLLFGALYFFTTTAAHAAKTSVMLAYRTAYVGSTSATPFFKGNVAQAQVTVTGKDGSYAGIWGSRALSGKVDDNFGNEVDYFLGHSFALNKGKALLDVSYYRYNLIPLTTTGGDIDALCVTLSKTSGTYRPSVTVEQDWGLGNAVLYKAGVSTAKKVAGRSFDIAGSAYGHTKAFGVAREPISAVELKVSTPIKDGDWALTPELRLVKNTGRSNGLAKDGIIFSLVYTH